MTNKQQIEFAQQLFRDCIDVLERKGKAYSGDDDAHANFKATADKIGNTPYQVWATYFGKHVDCIMRAIKANPEAPVDDTEGMRGRIIDAVNYLAILGGMLNAEKHEAISNTTAVDPKEIRDCITCKYAQSRTDEKPCSFCYLYNTLPNWQRA